jgi:DNA-binding CsgD family transcriptional regulator
MTTSGLLRPRADWVRILEAAYEPGADDATWAREVVDSARHIFQCDDRVSMQVVEHDAECVAMSTRFNVATDREWARAATQTRIEDFPFGAQGFRTFFYPSSMVLAQTELDASLEPDQRAFMASFRQSVGVKDLVGIVVHPAPGVVLVLSCGFDRRVMPTRHERSLLSQIGLHLESAYRLRSRPEVVKGTLTLKGANALWTSDAHPEGAIAEQARRIEHSLTKKGRGQHEGALDLWTALIAGRYSLVSRGGAGTRRYLVLENTPHSQPMRALTEREVDVLSLSARGIPTKLVSYGLGLATSTVSSTLARAASKLGLSTRLELLRLAATLARDPRSCALAETLTAAEGEVLALLREGLSNEQIAQARSRSVRTVANQVASLLRKTRSPSRRALIASAE